MRFIDMTLAEQNNYLELSTDDDLVDAIVRFADMRKRRVRTGPTNSKAVAA